MCGLCGLGVWRVFVCVVCVCVGVDVLCGCGFVCVVVCVCLCACLCVWCVWVDWCVSGLVCGCGNLVCAVVGV